MNRKAISSFNVKSNGHTKAARQKRDQSEKTNLRCFKSKHWNKLLRRREQERGGEEVKRRVLVLLLVLTKEKHTRILARQKENWVAR